MLLLALARLASEVPPAGRSPAAPGPETLARTARTAAVLEWMIVIGLVGVSMVVILTIIMRVAKPRRGKARRERTPGGSAWLEAGKRMGLETSGPREDPERDL